MSSSRPPPTAIRKLPVSETISRAYGSVGRNFRLLFRAIAFPYVLSVLLSLSLYLTPYSESWLINYLFNLILLIPYTIFGVAWHQLSLLGPLVAGPTLIPRWKRRHQIFFIYAVFVVSIYSLPVAAFISGIGDGHLSSSQVGEDMLWILSLLLPASLILGLYVLLPYLMMRCSFVFPAIAVGERYGLRHSWTHTRKEGFSLLIVVAATGIPAFLIIAGFQYALDELSVFKEVENTDAETLFEFIATAASSVIGFVYLILSYIIEPFLSYIPIAFMVSAISIAFGTICS